jgi:hypothetical protein
MSATLGVTLVGILLIAVFGFIGRRRPVTNLSEWTVGGRRFGAVTMWFLQAGEVFTTFTFLGMAGLAFTGGVASFYALPYIPLAYIGLYFLGPVIWRRSRLRGHLTQADFVADFYDSRLLGAVVAVFGVVFLLPYLQLQITGLGLAVQLATGNATSANVSIVIAFALTVAFVLWSGIRGVATTSYFKDVLMIVVLIVLLIAIPATLTGGIGATFERVLATHPDMLRIHAGEFNQTWFFTSMLASTIGVLFMTLPHQWPALLSAKSSKALRRNYVFLPVYSVALALPMVIGFTGLVVVPAVTGNSRGGHRAGPGARFDPPRPAGEPAVAHLLRARPAGPRDRAGVPGPPARRAVADPGRARGGGDRRHLADVRPHLSRGRQRGPGRPGAEHRRRRRGRRHRTRPGPRPPNHRPGLGLGRRTGCLGQGELAAALKRAGYQLGRASHCSSATALGVRPSNR